MQKTDTTNGRRIKLLILSIIAGIIIFLVLIWACSVVFGRKKTENTGTTTIETTAKAEAVDEIDTTDEQKTTTEYQVSETTVSTSEQTQTQNQTQTQTTTVSNKSNIPHTGPAETALSAVALGVIATLICVNFNLIKSKATK